MNPIWISLSGAVAAVAATAALRRLWPRVRLGVSKPRAILVAALGWVVAVPCGWIVSELVLRPLPAFSPRSAALIGIVVGLALYGLVVRALMRRSGGAEAGLAAVTLLGALQLTIFVGAVAAVFFGMYWSFGG
jgi:hypothetical protein